MVLWAHSSRISLLTAPRVNGSHPGLGKNLLPERPEEKVPKKSREEKVEQDRERVRGLRRKRRERREEMTRPASKRGERT